MKSAVASFSVGTMVSWSSQANGSWLEKIGRIVEVVPAGRGPTTAGDFGAARDHESYVVAIQRPKSIVLRWPRASKLKRAKAPKAAC